MENSSVASILRLDQVDGPVLQHDFDPGPGSIGAARDAARRFLVALRRTHPTISASAEADVLVAVSELVTNTLRHTGGPGTLCLGHERGRIHITVRDTSLLLPRPRPPDLTGNGGLGWPFLERLADSLTVTVLPDGKEVHARLPWPTA